MAQIYIEIKGADLPASLNRQTPTPQRDNHVAANLAPNTTASWTLYGATTEGTQSLIVANPSTDTVAVAVNNAYPGVTPTRYHVIPPGGQREIFVPPSSSIVAVTL